MKYILNKYIKKMNFPKDILEHIAKTADDREALIILTSDERRHSTFILEYI